MTESQSPRSGTAAYEAVVGLDFSELSERALSQAFELASAHEHAEVHVLVVGTSHQELLELPNRQGRFSQQEAQEVVRKHVAALVTRYQEQAPLHLERVAVYVVGGEAAEQLVALASALDADVIVVGTHGRKGVRRMVLGSVAESVVRKADCAVHVVRPRDFLSGEPLPEVQPALAEGAPHLKNFEHRRTYHYVERVSRWTNRTMPVS